MTYDEKLESKRENAIKAHILLISFLDSHGFSSWSERFRDVVNALDTCDLKKAITLEKAIPRAGMGAFGDFFIDPITGEEEWETWSKFVFFSSAQQKSISNIRAYLEYNLDNELLDLDYDGKSIEAKKEALKQLR
jgi:hypothetical protein